MASPASPEKNKDLHMCSSVWGRDGENFLLYLHAEEEPQRQMNGGSLFYLPDRPSSFFPSGLTGGASPPRSGAWRAGSSPAPTQLPGRHCAAVPVRCHGNWQPYQTKGERQMEKLKGLTFPFSEDWVEKFEGSSLGLKSKAFRTQGNWFLSFKSKTCAYSRSTVN